MAAAAPPAASSAGAAGDAMLQQLMDDKRRAEQRYDDRLAKFEAASAKWEANEDDKREAKLEKLMDEAKAVMIDAKQLLDGANRAVGLTRRKRPREEDDVVKPVDWDTMGRPVSDTDLPRTKEDLVTFLEQDLLVKFPVPGPDLAIPDSFMGSFYSVNGGLMAGDIKLCSGATGPPVDQPQTDDTENMLQRYTDNSIVNVLVALRGRGQDGERRSKRYRNSASIVFQRGAGEEEKGARALHNKRPDFCFNYDGQTVFQGEEKAANNMQGAMDDIRTKMAWERRHMGDRLPYLLAYAASGTVVQFLMVEAGGKVTALLRGLDAQVTVERLCIVRTAVNVARLLPALAECVPSSVRSVGLRRRPDGVTIGRSGSHFIKTVNFGGDGQAAQYASQQLVARLYSEVLTPHHGLPYIVNVCAATLPTRADPKLRLELSPLAADPFRGSPPTDVAVARVALRHVLLALEAFHGRGWCHRDVRWPNVLQRTDGSGAYMLIDFEFAAPHNTKVTWPNDESQPKEAWLARGNDQVGWAAKHDLWQVGALLNPFVMQHTEAEEPARVLRSLRDGLTAAEVLALPFFRE